MYNSLQKILNMHTFHILYSSLYGVEYIRTMPLPMVLCLKYQLSGPKVPSVHHSHYNVTLGISTDLTAVVLLVKRNEGLIDHRADNNPSGDAVLHYLDT